MTDLSEVSVQVPFSLRVWPRPVLVTLAFLVGWLPGVPVAAATETPSIRIKVDSPNHGELVRNKVHLASIRGSAQAGTEGALDFDVLLTIDVSFSTRFPSGIDVDGDGEIGFNPHQELVAPGTYDDSIVCTDPGDTILAAEVRAARLLLEALEGGPTRVGVVAFSGEGDPRTGRRIRYDQQDAWVDRSLTDDFASVREALDGIERRGPHGATNFAAAIRLAVTELAGLGGALSSPRPGAKRVVLFLTDGQPSFPYGLGAISDPEDTEAAISAARLAHKAGVVIHTFALGRHALAKPIAATEISRITAGSYTPVRNPGEIVAFLQGVSFANVDDVVITNLTLREVSYDISLAPDGSFSGFVPVRIGSNSIQVTALSSDGEEASVRFAFEFEESGLSEREQARELERIRRRNKELLILLEGDRIRRFRQRQREVVIEADEPDEADPAE